MTQCAPHPSDKPGLRQRAKQTLVALSPVQKQQQSERICQKLSEYINTYTSRAVFIPFDYEPTIFPFVQKLWEHDKTVLLPQVHDNQLRLAHYSRDSVVTQGVYGEGIIQDPVCYAGPLDVCLVPGLAFDVQGRRIGHGKGYYDRFLLTNSCYRIGVGFSQIIVDVLPHDDFDQQMHIVIS